LWYSAGRPRTCGRPKLGISLEAIASDCFSEVSIEDATQA